jgi:hypothetical protein
MGYKLALPASLLCFVLLTIFSLHIPFFWDTAYFAKQSNYFFQHGFVQLIPSDDLDNGGFPLYGISMALCWKLFGRSLAVSHLFIGLFLAGIAYGYYRLAKRFLRPRVMLLAVFLLFLEPCFITQSVLMTNDILLLCFFLGALNALLSRKTGLYALFLVCLSLCSIRGLATAGSLAGIHFVLEFRKGRTTIGSILSYVPLLFCILAWAVYHHIHSGWTLFSPLRTETDEHFLNLKGMAKQFVLTSWKLLDSGRIFCWVFLAWGIYFLANRKQINSEFKTLLILLFVPLITILLLLIPISNPSSSRYFMPTYLILSICICFIFQHLGRKTVTLCFSLLAAALLSGNFWIYPERFSNGWDTSLKVLPFFRLKQQMISYVEKAKINPKEIGTQFPLIDSSIDSDLDSSGFQFTNALSGPVSKFHYYLHSNVCNTDLLPQIVAIRLRWKVLKEVKKGEVYLCLYENPDWVDRPQNQTKMNIQEFH